MSQILRANEYVKIEVHFSYKVFVLPMLFMCIGILMFLAVFFGAADNLNVIWLGKVIKLKTLLIYTGIGLLIPYIYKRIDNRLKIYAVTNQRIYIRRGIINIKEKDIPLPQINDVQISQSLIQRFFRAADVVIQVGNDESRIFIEDINRPREFRDTIINAIYDLKKEDEMMQKAQHQAMEAKQRYAQQQYQQDNYNQQQYSNQQYQYPQRGYQQPQYSQQYTGSSYPNTSNYDDDDYEKPFDPDGNL